MGHYRDTRGGQLEEGGNLLPRGMKLSHEEVWERVAFFLSMKMRDPPFAGQTKERLSARGAAGIAEGTIHDAFSLWLNQNAAAGEAIAQRAIEHASARMKAARQVVNRAGVRRQWLQDKGDLATLEA